MVLDNLGKHHQQTRDQLGSEPTIHEIYKTKNDNVIEELGPLQDKKETNGHSFIVGSSINGLLGTNTGTEDGQQQVLGSAGQVITLLRVINVNNTHIERFKFDNFKDASNTNATWSTSQGKIIF